MSLTIGPESSGEARLPLPESNKTVDKETKILQDSLKTTPPSSNQPIHAQMIKGEPEVKDLFKGVLSDEKVLNFVMDHILMEGKPWKELLPSLIVKFGLSYSQEALREVALQAYFQEITYNLYRDPNQNFLNYSEARQLLSPDFEECKKIFPGIQLNEIERRASLALEKLNNELFDFQPTSSSHTQKIGVEHTEIGRAEVLTLDQTIDRLVQNYLEPYFTGQITQANEPQPHIPFIDRLKAELKDAGINDSNLIETAIHYYVRASVSHAHAISGRKLYNQLRDEIILNGSSEDPDQVKQELMSEFNLEKFQQKGERKSLVGEEYKLIDPLFKALKRDFPNENFTIEDLKSKIISASQQILTELISERKAVRRDTSTTHLNIPIKF